MQYCMYSHPSTVLFENIKLRKVQMLRRLLAKLVKLVMSCLRHFLQILVLITAAWCSVSITCNPSLYYEQLNL